MPSPVSYLGVRLAATGVFQRHGVLRIGLIAAVHLAALTVMLATEVDYVARVAFLLTWGLVNCFWIVVLRRPLAAAAISLVMFTILILLSQLKHNALLMTVSFVDVMVIDTETIRFLLTVFPQLQRTVVMIALIVLPVLVLLWMFDPFRVRRRAAAAGGAVCLLGISVLSAAAPTEPWEAFFGDNYVSKFVRSGAMAVSELASHGLLDSDIASPDQLKSESATACQPAGKRPHIVMVFDESSFDIRQIPSVKVPPGYGKHFRSFDGQQRNFIVEGAGGPSWYTEYNVLTGLSALSYGRFAYFVTRIAAGRVERGLPTALKRCGYHTITQYPTSGAFLSAKHFQTTTGIERFIDSKEMGTNKVEPDSFFFDRAARTIGREAGEQPLFMFLYLAANHFPWDYKYRPDLMTNWRAPGNAPHVDEYLRRQTMSARAYENFVDRLKRDFPTESFLLVRFGDHQPDFASTLIEPGLSEAEMGRRFLSFDQRYFQTYYALDTINYNPPNLTSARSTLDAPYLPLVVLEAAGLSLSPSFAEQKKILERCQGQFYRCRDGAEARRFNRLLIDAGLIKGL